ncbi:MAG TPA: RNA polymerase sigma factor [Acidimicrobiales bacterium]|nr:RNA polymerase sigma factor [Acidimicrobiales bacterium]
MSGLGNPGEPIWPGSRVDPGDREARFAELYGAHFRPLVAFCRRQVGPGGDPEAVAQEAFLRAWASWDRYAPARPFWPWVSTIARRLCIDDGRRRRRAQARSVYAVDGIAPPEPEEVVVALDEYTWARAALAELRPQQRRVLQMRDVDGWSYDRIASHEGTTVESVRGALKRSRQALRAAYTRLADWNPVVVALVALRNLTRRFGGRAQRAHIAVAASGIGDRTANALAVAVAVGLGATGGGAISAHPPLPTVAATAALPGTTSGSRPVSTSTTAGANAGRVGSGPVSPAGAASSHAPGPAATATPPDDGLRLPGQGGATPEESGFVSFTPSPGYANDHEVYASGIATRGCLSGQCPTLFRSTDGGVSWVRVWSVLFGGGTVLLPPAYPTDHRIFEIDAHALRMSTDGGHLFRPLTPLGGHAAMSPGFSSGDRQILVGAMPGWIYHDGSSVVTPFNLAPEPTSVALSFAYSPSYTSDGKLIVAGTGLPLASQSLVSRCTGATCTPASPLAGSVGTPSVLASRSYATSGLAYAWQQSRFYRSVDGGATFAALSLPATGSVQDVAEDKAGDLFVALLATQLDGGSTGGVFVSHDAGTSWNRIGAGSALDRGATAVMPLPDGRLLVAPYAASGGGLLCSGNNGGTFAPRCSMDSDSRIMDRRVRTAVSR